MSKNLEETGGNASHHHETPQLDQERAAAATEAGTEFASGLMRLAPRPATFEQLNARSVQLGRIANLRDDALTDPRAFVEALFADVDITISDLAYDKKNDYPFETAKERRSELFDVAADISRIAFGGGR